MKAVTKILTGAAGLAAVIGFASPASAQYYPSQPYGYGYGNNSVGQVIGQILGYGRYQYGNYGYNVGNNNMLVDQCVRAVEARLGGGYGYDGYGYNNYGYGNQGYGGGGRVQGITSIERKNSGIRVKGVASSNRGGYGGYGYNNAGYPDIRFNCKADFNGRVVDMDFDRINTRYRNYGYRGY